MVTSTPLSGAQKATLTAIKQTSATVDTVTKRLATGLKVSSALDNADSFFIARALSNRASDLNRLLDGIGQNIRAIEETEAGVEAINDLLFQAEALASTTQDFLLRGEDDPSIVEVGTEAGDVPLDVQILGANPVGYWRLNDAAGPAVNLGSLGAANDGIYQFGPTRSQPALYDNGGEVSTQFDGTNDVIRIPDSPQINLSPTNARTVELVFNADDVSGRQVLYEEGATVNGLTIYIDNGRIFVTGEDDNGGGRWFDANINAPIVAGQTYHIAFVFDRFDNSFSGYLDGQFMGSVTVANSSFPSHSGDIGIGGVRGGVQFHDGENGANAGFNFQGRISDVAIYNSALSQPILERHAQALNFTTNISYINPDFDKVLDQIEQITNDANYRGINLLRGENMITRFNERGTSLLITEGSDFTVDGLGLKRKNFNDLDDVEEIIFRVREAREAVRRYGFTLRNDLSIIEARENFTLELANNHFAGADDLTLADVNKEAANQLALQTRQALSTTALSLATQSQSQVLTLFQ